ncbi:MAG: hypothetical protein ACP5E2_14380 [Terracidiphilus sp.]
MTPSLESDALPADASPLDKLLAARALSILRRRIPGSHLLGQLLSELRAPDMLQGGAKVFHTAYRLLQRSLPLIPEEERPLISSYIDELAWLDRNMVKLSGEIFAKPEDRERFFVRGTKSEEREKDRRIVRSAGVEEHPLWCLVWEHHPVRKRMRGFRSLQAQALLAHLAIIRYWSSQVQSIERDKALITVDGFLSVRTRAIRHFVMANYKEVEAFRGLLASIPKFQIGQDLISHLTSTRDAMGSGLKSDVKLPPLLRDVILIIGLFRCGQAPKLTGRYRDEAPQKPLGSQPGNRPDAGTPPEIRTAEETSEDEDFHIEDISGADDDEQVEGDEESEEGHGEEEDDEEEDDEGNDDEEQDTDPDVSAFSANQWTSEERKASAREGLHPADALRSSTFYLANSRRGAARDWAQMNNQALGSAWNNLAIEELADGFELLRTATLSGGINEFEIFTLANVILARGFTEGKARTVVVRSDWPKTEEEIIDPTLVLPTEDRPGEWLIPVIRIPYSENHKEEYPGCHKCEKWFPLADYWGVGALMRRLFALRGWDWTGNPVLPFAPRPGKKKPSYSSRLAKLVASADPDGGPGLKSRFTFARIERVLFQKIVDMTAGNFVPAIYVSMRKHEAGEVHRYYETLAEKSIQEIEKKAISRIGTELAALGYVHSLDLTLEPSRSTAYIGSPMCPSIQSVHDYLAELKGTIITSTARLSQPDVPAEVAKKEVIERHNAYVLYTYAGVTIGSCHRPTGGGIPGLDQIDPDGILTIIDKGIDKARLAPVADAAFSQLEVFSNYMDNFDFATFLGQAPQGRVFLLDESGLAVELSSGAVESHLPFVVNFARHLVRTEFSAWSAMGDQRVLPERIAALLGHSIEGEQPYGRHSTFDYQEFVTDMQSALGDLLKKLEFEPMSILGTPVITYGPCTRRSF